MQQKISGALDTKIFAGIVDLLYSQVSAASLGAIFTAICLVVGLNNAVSGYVLYSWFAAVLFVSALRFMIVKSYRYVNPPPNRAFVWYILFLLVTIVSGLVWMSAGIILAHHDSVRELLITFALAGIAAGSIPFFSPSKLISTIFILLVLPLFSLNMYFDSASTHHMVGILGFIFMGALLASSYRINAAITSTLKLKFLNDELIEKLSTAKLNVETINVNLQAEINERIEMEQLLRSNEEQYRLVTNALPVLIAYIDIDLCFRFNNNAYMEWFNKSMEQINGRPMREIMGETAFATFMEHYQALLAGKKIIYETMMTFHEDHERYVSVTLIPHFNEHGFNGVFSLISDMTPRINYLATHDPLTDLPNRSLFNARFSLTLKHALRDGSRAALFFLDLDHFKKINDTLGHDVGDQLLVKVVERLKYCVRDSDMIARLGGDEFTIILEKIPNIQFVIAIAERICRAMAQGFQLNDRELYITTSIGISVFPNDGDNIQSLLKNADMAMYRAKENGRNKFEFFTPSMNQIIQKKIKIETCLRTALEKNELSLHFQPLVNLKTNKIISVESLLRWQHPEMGFISPNEFIPIAEETDLIDPIGEWVLRQSCEFVKKWHNKGHTYLSVAVNISARQFLNRKFVRVIKDILQSCALDGQFVTLELTESLIMSDVETNLKIVNELKELNIKIAIDDFGTGYSSLSYLKRFSSDIIKIDKSFITDFSDHQDAAIVKAIIALAHTLNMVVVAEGVETPAQLTHLKEFGCDEVQGYLLYRPISEEELEGILSKQLVTNREELIPQ